MISRPAGPRRGRRWAPFMLLAAAACANEPEPLGHSSGGTVLLAAALSAERSDADPAAGSPYGSYLAGLFAGNARDLTAAADFMLQALSYDPADVQLLNRTLFLLAADGRHDKAAEIARRMNVASPGNGLAGLILAVEAVRRGDVEEAQALLEATPERGLSGVTGPMLLAYIQIMRGDGPGAMARMAPLRNKSGFEVLYGLHTGLMHDLLGDAAQAREAYEQALQALAQPSLRVVWLAGNFFERQGDAARAVSLYETFLKASPSSDVISAALTRAKAAGAATPVVTDPAHGMAEALFDLASLLSQERAEELALSHIHLALRLRPDFTIAKVLLGEILQAQGRSAKAIKAYRTVPADSPFSWTIRLRIAEELEQLDRIDEAAAELEAMAASEPARAESLIRLGNLLRNKERFAEAVSAYDRAATRLGEPERRHWTFYYFRGIALERTSNWPRAEQDFLLALNLEPEQPFVMNYLAYSWVEKKLHLDKAKGMLARAVELRPDDGFIVDSLGWVYYRLGEYELGVKYLERAVELRPQDPVINDHLGDAYWRVGRRHEARFQWRRALSLEPEAAEVSKIEAKIDRGLPDEPKDI